MATKILVVGPVQGQLTKAFQKIAKLLTKQDFAFAVVAGDLFGEEVTDEVQALLDGSLPVPLPTYFTVGDHVLPRPVQEKLESTGEVANNLLYLGRKGTLTTAEGIKVVFLGGREVQNEQSLTQSIGKYDPLFLENEARVLQGAHNAHILLTNQWPSRIENGSDMPISEPVNGSSTAITNLCATLKPRYHFSRGQSRGWKREPFCWPTEYSSDETEAQVTRFESLGAQGQKDWISAFVLDPTKPASSEGAQRTAPFTTVSPQSKRKRDPVQDNEYPKRADSSRPRARGNKRHRPNFDPNDCFMCLGKPTFSAEMVVSIADESFLTSLRGPLPTETTFPQLKSTGNLMIIPMYHAADETSHGRRAISERQTEFIEMTRYRHSLQHMLLEKAKGELGAVCWEVNRTGIRHFHWQWIACPQAMIGKGLVEAAFKVAGEKNDYEKFHNCDPDALLPNRQSDFFRVWIWSAAKSTTEIMNGSDKTSAVGNGGKSSPSAASPVEQADAIASGQDDKSTTPLNTVETCMYFELPPDQRFNIQFGRTVMSGLLKLEDRADWRSVPVEDGDEQRDAEAWKEDLGPWDFAMS